MRGRHDPSAGGLDSERSPRFVASVSTGAVSGLGTGAPAQVLEQVVHLVCGCAYLWTPSGNVPLAPCALGHLGVRCGARLPRGWMSADQPVNSDALLAVLRGRHLPPRAALLAAWIMRHAPFPVESAVPALWRVSVYVRVDVRQSAGRHRGSASRPA